MSLLFTLDWRLRDGNLPHEGWPESPNGRCCHLRETYKRADSQTSVKKTSRHEGLPFTVPRALFFGELQEQYHLSFIQGK